MKVIEGGVTAPKGFQAAGIFAGIKKDKKDMAMVYSEVPCVVAGTFTTNVVKAAPVKWDQHVVYEVGKASAIVANSGIANACTFHRRHRTPASDGQDQGRRGKNDPSAL